MAYLDLTEPFLQHAALAVPAPIDLELMAAEPIDFHPTEWAVIALARADGLDTLDQPRRSRLARLLFGPPRSYALTGERLEALRRLAVEAWRRPGGISLPTLGGFIAMGFSSAQLALLLSTTGALPVIAKLVSASLTLARSHPVQPGSR